LPELFERGIGSLLDEFSQALQTVLIEGGLDASGVGPGVEGSGLATELEQSGDGREIDGETCRELTARAFAAIDGVEDALAKIVRRGLQDSPPVDLASKPCAERVCPAVRPAWERTT
jgi:hypothetical protein